MGPAVAGSIRLNSSGASERPTSRASRQPRITSAIAVTTRTGRSSPKICSRYSLASRNAPISGTTMTSSMRARLACRATCAVSARARAGACGMVIFRCRNRGIT